MAPVEEKILIEHIREFFNKLGHKIADGATPNWEALIKKTGLGQLPEGYNRKIHGPYDPARWYGKPATPFGQVLVKDVPSWLLQRSWTPMAIGRAFSRAYWRWLDHSYFPRSATLAWPLQLAFGTMTFSYILNYYQHHACHKRYKHRW